jgi:hypothetical protein
MPFAVPYQRSPLRSHPQHVNEGMGDGPGQYLVANIEPFGAHDGPGQIAGGFGTIG